MKKYFHTVNRGIIILFCLWHMAAIALYALPKEILPQKSALRRAVEPYVFTFSQWQGWALFAPHVPRTHAFWIDVDGRGHWFRTITLTTETLGWMRSDGEWKALRTLSDRGSAVEPIEERYVQSFCEVLGLPEGTGIRLVLWQYAQGRRILSATQCPTPEAELWPIHLSPKP